MAVLGVHGDSEPLGVEIKPLGVFDVEIVGALRRFRGDFESKAGSFFEFGLVDHVACAFRGGGDFEDFFRGRLLGQIELEANERPRAREGSFEEQPSPPGGSGEPLVMP